MDGLEKVCREGAFETSWSVEVQVILASEVCVGGDHDLVDG